MHKLSSVVDNPAVARRAMAIILLIAAVTRVVFWIALPDQSSALPDAAIYRMAAQDILSHRLIGVSNVMPGYPLLIAAFGGVAISQIAADTLLSVATIWLIGRIVIEITKDKLAALIAAAFWAASPIPMFYAAVGLSETLFVFLMLLGFFFFYRASFWIGSTALVLTILTRPLIELIAPALVLIFAMVVHQRSWRRSVLDLAKFMVIYLVLMLPWWVHNYARYNSFVRLNAGAGIVLYSGNNPMNQTGGGIVGVDFDERAFSGIADPLARDRAMQRAALEYIRENPRRFIEMAGRKFMRLWRPWPYTPAYQSPIYVLVVAASFLPILALALAGFVWGVGRYWRFYAPMVLLTLYITAVHMITIASVRYRFPMEPILPMFAAPLIAAILRKGTPTARLTEGPQT